MRSKIYDLTFLHFTATWMFYIKKKKKNQLTRWSLTKSNSSWRHKHRSKNQLDKKNRNTLPDSVRTTSHFHEAAPISDRNQSTLRRKALVQLAKVLKQEFLFKRSNRITTNPESFTYSCPCTQQETL